MTSIEEEFVPPAAPGLEYALTVALELDHERGAVRTDQMSNGLAYGFIGVKGGWFRGPRISGTAIPGGGDWPTIRANGVAVFDASYLLQADDGTQIRLHNRGLRVDPELRVDGGAFVPGQPRQFHEPKDVYFRVTPLFDVEEGPHDWLAKRVFVGIGERRPSGNRIHYYAVM